MFNKESRKKIGAASLISLGYLGQEEQDSQENIEFTDENWNETQETEIE